MKKMKMTVTAGFFLALLSAFLALPIQGCAPVIAALPEIIAAVTDGMQIIDVIERFVQSYFVAHPDPETQKKIGAAAQRCREALNVALRIAQGSKELNDEQVDKAFDDFKAAYLELLALTKPFGVTPVSAASGKMKAAPNQLEVPEPLAFRARVKR